VREAYWKIYNNLYVYAADALTPIYPRLDDVATGDPDNARFNKGYLDLIV
jgi:hypothetical protein